MTLLLLYLTLALVVSFLCSLLEAVLLSLTASHISMLEQQGQPAGAGLRRLKEDINPPLAAILTLNTAAHTIGAAGVGAQAQVVFGSGYMAGVSALLTLAILVVSEIIPKTLGARYWRALAPHVVMPLKLMIRLLYPLVWLSLLITSRLGSNASSLSLSREEFSAMAHRGEQEGVFDADEARMLHNLMRFGSLGVTDVLTPRVVVEMLDESLTVGELRDRLPEIRFSRLPVYRDSRENITGYVLKNELFGLLAAQQPQTPLAAVRRDLLVVPDSQSVRGVFRQLLLRREHIAMVVDEYGGFCGIATMEDVVETLLGLEIVDEVDSVEDMRKLARRRWLERARAMGLVQEDEDVVDLEQR